MSLKFEWDPAKARLNEAKHGISFEQATSAFIDPFLVEWLDEDAQHEDRWKLLGLTRSGVLLIVYAERSDEDSVTEVVVRIISAGRANKDEQRLYQASPR